MTAVTDLTERLASVPLFADLSPADLERICSAADEISLEAGARLFAEGDHGDHAYVITAGEVEIRKASLDRDVLLAVQGVGDLVGEMALLQEEPRNATAVARTDAELARIPKAVLDDLIATSGTASRAMFSLLLERWRDTQSQLRQSERMAQLGTLTAGLAHELNNPSAAVQRAAQQLSDAISRLEEVRRDNTLSDPARHLLAALLADTAEPPSPLSTLERSDREEALIKWLERAGIEDGWELAPALVELGLDPDELTSRHGGIAREELATVLELVRASGEVSSLLGEVAQGAARLSAIVQALKSYAYLDRAPEQTVDVRQGLDDTLLLLAGRLTGIDVVREYEPELPSIEAVGSELNQVWTHLIDNAAAAVQARVGADARIVIRARPGDDSVVVEVEDNGTGIPPEHRERIFDAFFTTKPPGAGAGLGLDMSFRVVVHEHRGILELVHSEPGRTLFRVELPRARAKRTAAGAA